MADSSLRERRQSLLDHAGLLGETFCRAYSAQADEWLCSLANRAIGDSPRHVALLAVGGYGRGSLCPFSDLDVVFVHAGRKNMSALAEAIWYPVWDEGVHLDHSVRRPTEVLDAARDDLRVALGLVDARMIWGDERVAEPLLADFRSLWRSRLGAAWLPDLLRQMEARHETQGDVAFLLEPDLKEGHGGLRDINVLRAVATSAPLFADYVDLATIGPAEDVFTSVRVELHRTAGRALDRLLLQEQDQIASALSYSDADALMGAVSAAGRTVAWLSDDAWRRRRFWQVGGGSEGRRFFDRRRRAGGGGQAVAETPGTGVGTEDLDLEPGISIVDGEVTLSPGAQVDTDSSLAFRLGAIAAERDLPIATQALHRLVDRMPEICDPWPSETRLALVRILLTGRPAIDALESLDQHGLLVRLLPEWASVRNKPQRNAYHRFTVDRHLLEAAANSAESADQVDRPDLLVIGTLFHDIGKGFPGDHTEVGIELVGVLGTRMGFAPADVDVLVDMCRHHLLLPEMATRRDLDDPATIETVAAAAGNRRTLELLEALTKADSLATDASSWGTWKAGLVSDLVERVGRRLDRHGAAEESPIAGAWVTDIHHAMVAEVRTTTRPLLRLDPPRLIVAAPDRPGLLASVAGILALHGLDVRSADVSGELDVAIEVFTVEVMRGSWPESDRMRDDLEAVTDGRLILADRLAAKAEAYGRRRPSAAQPVVPHVTVDNTASASSSVVEVRAADQLGLLHRVTQALFDCRLDVVSARVSTFGDSVVDAFYVRNASGRKVTDPATLELITRTLHAIIQ